MSTQNIPDLWKDKLPRLKPDGHKYDRGHAVIVGAPELTGATRLAAESCARIGAGLVTVIAPETSGPIYRSTLPAHIMVEDMTVRDYPTADGKSTYESIHHHFADPRRNVLLMGPGGCCTQYFEQIAYRAWDRKPQLKLVMDAGAVTAFQGRLLDLNAFADPETILTPHEAEFRKLYSNADTHGDLKLATITAAREANCIIVLKGKHTFIATPDGCTQGSDHATPYLATAGTGDVLAGMITGLLAQGMPAFEAACAAVWIHGEAGLRFGPGLVASDLPDLLPAVMKDLLE